MAPLPEKHSAQPSEESEESEMFRGTSRLVKLRVTWLELLEQVVQQVVQLQVVVPHPFRDDAALAQRTHAPPPIELVGDRLD